MFTLDRDNDTICAISTAAGVGAIAIVRLSGGKLIDEIIRKIAPFLGSRLESHKLYFGNIVDPVSHEYIDEVLISYFANGRSFTGETSFEISCHGSPAIAQRILQALITSGARVAEKGEFTYRAFKNGRIDLAQAESTLALIQSTSNMAARQALSQLKGSLSKQIFEIEENLTWALSRLEANLDFSSENIEFAANEDILNRIKAAQKITKKLINSFNIGRQVAQGIKVVLVGLPNVGKSSLLNRLADQDRSIVSPIAGTTRDTVDVDIQINGHRVTLVDSAGLHEAADEIERLGIERSHLAMNEADIILSVFDISQPTKSYYVSDSYTGKKVIYVGNKADLANVETKALVVENKIESAEQIKKYIKVSATTGMGIDKLFDEIGSHLLDQTDETSVAILQARQFELLNEIESYCERALNLLIDNASSEFVISELNVALEKAFHFLGKKFDDEVLDRVFKDFCLGK